MNSRSISFSALPQSQEGFTKLYHDYLNDFSKVQHYFESDFRSDQHILQRIGAIEQRYACREEVTSVLMEQNKELGASEQTMTHLRNFGSANTFAVVTGQQVGILGGPLYTIYKTITAISLARKLNAAYPQYNFVPVFWLEEEDHDFDEVSSVGLVGVEGMPAKISYLVGGKPLERNIGAVGDIALDASLEPFFHQISQCLQPSDFKAPLIESLRRSYTATRSFGKAFASLLYHYFDEDGLVFIHPSDPRLKKIVAPIFQREIQEYPRVSQLVIQRSAELEEEYHAQIKTKALNLFLFHKGGRYMIEPREHDFSLKGTRHFLTKEELLHIATDTPEQLSPNVALRPICQDTLLPTIAYIAGPSEVAYFAQLKTVYENFGIKMPVIYPRASVTILEDRIQTIMEKFNLDVIDFFHNPDGLQHKVVEQISEVKIDEMFQDASRRTDEIFSEMKFGLNYVDSTLLGPLDSTREKIESHLVNLKEKVNQAQQRKHEVALRQLTKATNILFPNHNYQEREINLIYFLNKYGPGFLHELKESVTIDTFTHQILTPS